jgi:hypothetical protein
VMFVLDLVQRVAERLDNALSGVSILVLRLNSTIIYDLSSAPSLPSLINDSFLTIPNI